MSTLIAVSGLGILSLVLEIFNLRKILVPIILIGLLSILGLAIVEYHLDKTILFSSLYNMLDRSGFSQVFSILLIIIATLVITMSPQFYARKLDKIADYVSLKIFMLAGAIAMISFANLAMFFIGLEVMSIAAYILSSSEPRNIKSNEAGMKYFIMGAFASSFVLLGIALIYGAIGSFDASIISSVSLSNTNLPIWFNIGFVLISVGMLFKASIVPFHFWAPDVYEGSPTIVTAIMSTLVKVAAIGTLYKLVSIMIVGVTPAYKSAIIILSILSMTIGNITAIRQSNIKRMMAYSGISHAGFMIMTLLVTGTASNTIIYYAAAYSFAVIAAFAVIMSVCNNLNNEDMSNFYGLIRRQPLLTVILTCALFSLSGIPIFAGFFAKFFVFEQVLESGYLILVIFGIINSLIAVFYYLSVVNLMVTKKGEATDSLKVPSEYMIVSVIAITLNILLGLFPSLIMNLKL